MLRRVTLSQASKPSFHICTVKIIAVPASERVVKIERKSVKYLAQRKLSIRGGAGLL